MFYVGILVFAYGCFYVGVVLRTLIMFMCMRLYVCVCVCVCLDVCLDSQTGSVGAIPLASDVQASGVQLSGLMTGFPWPFTSVDGIVGSRVKVHTATAGLGEGGGDSVLRSRLGRENSNHCNSQCSSCVLGGLFVKKKKNY